MVAGEVYDPLFQVEQRAKGQVQEVAAAAGRVQDLHLKQPPLEGVEPDPRRVIVAFDQQVAYLPLHRLPFFTQRGHQHWLHHHHNVIGAGVMGPKVGTFGSV